MLVFVCTRDYLHKSAMISFNQGSKLDFEGKELPQVHVGVGGK